MASYNHEKYVAEAIQSVLDQTLEDFEFIIVDDGSTDGTVDEIRRFDDPRISFTPLDSNHGLAVAKTRAFDMARGKYVAILNSDDAFLPDKLEKQLQVLRERPEMGAVFTSVQVVDEVGRPFPRRDHRYSRVFDQPNRSRPDWLRRFFYEGNCLCAPSAVLPRKVVLDLGYLDKRYRQFGDLELWSRVCMRHPIYIHPEALTRFRVRDGNANTGAPSPEGSVRGRWEFPQLLRIYLAIPDEGELVGIFPEAASYLDPQTPLDSDGIAYVLARLALDRGGRHWECFALHTLFDLLEDDGCAANISERFGFDYRDLIDLTGRLDVFAAIPRATLTLTLARRIKRRVSA